MLPQGLKPRGSLLGIPDRLKPAPSQLKPRPFKTPMYAEHIRRTPLEHTTKSTTEGQEHT